MVNLFQYDTRKNEMKYKNYKSAIHNFAHSFQSIDFMKSNILAIDLLIDLNSKEIEPKITFDFIGEKIIPEKCISKKSLKLLNDYKNWLPEHFQNHNCDLDKLEKLEIEIWTDFDNVKTPIGMSNIKEILISSKTKWKADIRDEQTIEIKQLEIILDRYLKFGFPKFT